LSPPSLRRAAVARPPPPLPARPAWRDHRHAARRRAARPACTTGRL